MPPTENSGGHLTLRQPLTIAYTQYSISYVKCQWKQVKHEEQEL
nr:MAG TPA: hypothetical protein [Caudoviricetes sp.]